MKFEKVIVLKYFPKVKKSSKAFFNKVCKLYEEWREVTNNILPTVGKINIYSFHILF